MCLPGKYIDIYKGMSGADPGFGNGGAKICSEVRYIYERSELRAKRVTSEVSINQLGVGG